MRRVLDAAVNGGMVGVTIARVQNEQKRSQAVAFLVRAIPKGILDGLSGFQERGIRPKWVVIDDGWQRTTNDDALNTEQWDERLVALEANKRFRYVQARGEIALRLTTYILFTDCSWQWFGYKWRS